jgi:hypothetical protein
VKKRIGVRCKPLMLQYQPIGSLNGLIYPERLPLKT